MVFSIFRWELLRLGMGTLGRAIAFDARPSVLHRSRKEHLRNGVGALVSVASDVGVQGSLPASVWLASRGAARSDLDYAIAELRRARSGSGFASRHAATLALAVAASAGLAWRARSEPS